MPVAPEMLCHAWLSDRSYVLCDVGSPGQVIQYASGGFARMFHTKPSKCIGRKCGSIVGIQSILTDDRSLTTCAEVSGLSSEEVRQALKSLQERSSYELKQMFAVGTGSFVTLNRAFNGTLMVVTVMMQMIKNSDSGRCYAVGFQQDITKVISIQDLMHAMSCGKDVGLEEKQSFLLDCQGVLQRQEVLQYLHQKIEDALPFSSVQVDMSTQEGTSPTSTKRKKRADSFASNNSSEQEDTLSPLAARGPRRKKRAESSASFNSSEQEDILSPLKRNFASFSVHVSNQHPQEDILSPLPVRGPVSLKGFHLSVPTLSKPGIQRVSLASRPSLASRRGKLALTMAAVKKRRMCGKA